MAHLDSMRDTIAGKVQGKPVTWGELHDAFERVKPKPNWKYPINAAVLTARNEADSTREIETIREAVVFFCGCVPEIRHLGNYVFQVTAVGYYAAVGA